MKIRKNQAVKLLKAMGAKHPETWTPGRIVTSLTAMAEMEDVPDLEKREHDLLLEIIDTLDNDQLLEIVEPEPKKEAAAPELEAEKEIEEAVKEDTVSSIIEDLTSEEPEPAPEVAEVAETADSLSLDSVAEMITEPWKFANSAALSCFEQAASLVCLGIQALMVNETETPEKKCSEHCTKTPSVKKEKKEKIGKDRFGSRLGSNGAKINEQLSTEPKLMSELCVEAGFDAKKNFHGHLRKLVDVGLVIREGKEFYLEED